MFPHIQIFLKQTGRGTKRLALQLVLLCAVTVFFVVSLNLYANSMRNLQTVEDTYTTIATMEIYGYVNEAGELVHPGDPSCVGRHLLSVEDYDLFSLSSLNFVKDIHLRTRVAAYIPGHIPVLSELGENPVMPPEYKTLSQNNNVIRFVLDAEEPVTYSLRNGWKYDSFPIRILEQSNSLLVYPEQHSFFLGIPMLAEREIPQYADEIRRLNRSNVTDTITLYPGVEYIMVTHGSGLYWIKDEETGTYIWQEDGPYFDGSSGESRHYPGIGLNLAHFFYYSTYGLCYQPNRGLTNMHTQDSEKTFFSIQRYDDVKDDLDWADYIQAGEYDGSAFTTVLTDDIALVPAWYAEGMFLSEGRMITEEEYKSGAKVCMISAKMAYLQGWKAGDTLDLHLYQYDGYFDGMSNQKVQWNYPPNYSYWQDGFFEEDTYEIVGIFGQREFADFGETAEEVFYNPWNAIYIPSNAAPKAPAGPIQPSLLTIHLKNGKVDEFKAAVEKMGLTDQVPGEYEIKFSYFDQGYEKIKPGLDEMHRNAKLLLGLSVVLLVVTMILMTFLFAQQHKHSAGILRLLGGSKKQAFTAILACAAVVVAAGGVIGTVLGGVLTQSVGASILGDAAESAKVALSTGVSPVLTILSGIGCMALFLALTAIFTGTYIGKEPRALLPEDKA